MPRPSRLKRRPIGLALAGGGPFGAIYEIGVLMALQESLEGLELNELDCYVGVSAGSFLEAALANRIPIDEIYRLFIADGEGDGAITPQLFMRPAFGEYLRRARSVPPLLAHSAWRYLKHPISSGTIESFAALGRAIPTGIFDNESIHEYLETIFTRPGRTNDFRKLRRRLYLVATDLDSGESVSFGRRGHDQVPISRAVQASAALPGLFPPVEIEGRYFVDGALRKTLHASEALDDGVKLVLCVNPIVPFDAKLAALKGRGPHSNLIEGGLPMVLSQTFRAVIHSRMTVGISKYKSQYRGSDVVLFQPEKDDSEIFFTNLFSYSTRRRVCQHAYERTRRDLVQRAAELEPLLRRHGVRYRWDALRDRHRKLEIDLRRHRLAGKGRLPRAAGELQDTLRDLKLWMESSGDRRAA
ncbi:MAG: patatin-like phospholipase family protein [Usitatibacter sp.]